MTTLLGRDAETATLDLIIEQATGGTGRACVVHGEAGMGKTRLLAYAVESAPQLREVSISGVSTEQTLGYAGLHRLLGPFLPARAQLPPPQRDALGSAFGLSAEGPADLFLVGLASLTLLTDAAAEQGLLCIVDDAHWLDDESLAVLAFVARRLSADRIAMLFGVRDGHDTLQTLGGLTTVTVGGLPDAAAMELLTTQVDVDIDIELANRIIVSTTGCPLALLELTADLTAEQLRGGRVVSEPVPIGRQLEHHFHRQVEALGEAAQLYVLVAATETSGDPGLVRRVTSLLLQSSDLDGSTDEAEDESVASGLLSVDPAIGFRHPLIRSAAYAGATEQNRRRVHAALAATIDRAADPDRRAQHLAAAARGPDEDVAAELEEAAHRAGRRGGYSAEASFLVHAAQLTPAVARRSQRLLASAHAALNAGQLPRAETLLGEAQRDLQDDRLRADAMRLGARLRPSVGRDGSGPARLLAAADAFQQADPLEVRGVLLEALEGGLTSQRFTTGTTLEDVARIALATSRATLDSPTLRDLLLEGMAWLFVSRNDLGMPMLRQAAVSFSNGSVPRDDVPFLCNIGNFVANELADDETYGRWAGYVEEVSRSDGALVALQLSLLSRTKHETRRGRFNAAKVHNEEIIDLARATGQSTVLYSLLNVDLLAWLGSEETAPTAAALIELATSIRSQPPVAMAQLALTTLALGDGRYADALTAVRPLIDDHIPGWTCQALAMAVEAAVRSDDRATAARCVALLQDRAANAGTPWASAQHSRSRALLASRADAEELYLDAISLLEQTSVRTELAQTHLVYGEWLRRQKRRQDAQVQLQIAFEMFSTMGAAAFARRASGELGATGLKARRVTSSSAAANLTPQEAQIAQLASVGATNAEIGVRLFISASTVDFHLRKVFRKLGITSRRQLAVPGMLDGNAVGEG